MNETEILLDEVIFHLREIRNETEINENNEIESEQLC